MAVVKLPVTSPYTSKDQSKSDRATKFIGRGSDRSSTAAYALAWGQQANSGEYKASDVVFVSAEGNRSNRVAFDAAELQKAIDAKSIIITDTEQHRTRPYNIGEREVAGYLKDHDYTEAAPGEWREKRKLRF